MPILTLRNITLSHGGLPLFEQGALTIEPGEHVCLIGRNGAGKSSLLKLLLGQLDPEQGNVETPPHLKVAFLAQEIPTTVTGTVKDIVAQGLAETAEVWERDAKVDHQLSKMQLDGQQLFENLSGGLKRRVLLAQALVSEPELLLLDEPTNHLDIEAILWLETFLKNFNKAFIMVTHDRYLMQQLSQHIIEIDNGRLYSWRGRYDKYLQVKETRLIAEEKANTLFDKRLAQEEVWIRQGIKARRTRNEGRVRALKKMREAFKNRRVRGGEVSLTTHDIKKSGKLVFDIQQLNFSYHQQCLIKEFSSVVARGDKIGLIGNNGSGKSTLIQLLLQQLTPDSGHIQVGTQLEVGLFDQHRLSLDSEKTVFDNVSEGSDFVVIGDEKKHIMSYLQDFLFTPERARSRVKSLSGGERNRVMLAKLLAKPSNLLVLDEPTNDLDIETLELLEEYLGQYQGTLLLVSHDRAFLNNIVTRTWVMEGDGKVYEYAGGYDDYLLQHQPVLEAKAENKKTHSSKSSSSKLNVDTVPKSAKLDREQEKELKRLTKKIEKLEAEINTLQQRLHDPQLYQQQPDKFAELTEKLKTCEEAVSQAYARWEELES